MTSTKLNILEQNKSTMIKQPLKLIFIFLFGGIYLTGNTQIRKSELFKNDSSILIPYIELPSISNDSLTQYYDNNATKNTFIFAKNFPQNIKTNLSGIWVKNKDNSYSWLLKVKSKSAFSLNFTLENIVLSQGSKLYILNSKSKKTYGPFSHNPICKDSTLFIEPISGDELVFELDVPSNSNSKNNYFSIVNIGHDFRDFYKINSIKRGKSGSCEHDINCGIGLDWQKEKQSIVEIVFPSNVGTQSITGTLINNTSNNKLPYILTTKGIKDSKTASSAIFYFNYENSSCQASDAVKSQFISGSDLIATSKDTTALLDFTLLRLKSNPQDVFSVYYSGWSINNIKENNIVALHHPKGDPLKISYSKNAILDGSFTDAGYMSNSHWQIALWDTGATEAGSSGCPIFNSKHQIIGTLSGGDAICGNAINDYFAKLYKSWNYFSDSTNQLKYWLDPMNTGVTELLGYEPITLKIVSKTNGTTFNQYLQDTIEVTSNTTWTATSNATWLTVNPSTSTNNAKLILTATTNTGIARSATVTVSATGAISQTLMVSQADGIGTAIKIEHYDKKSYHIIGNTVYFDNGEIFVYTILGQRISTIGDKSITLKSGIYIIQTSIGTDKIVIFRNQ